VYKRAPDAVGSPGRSWRRRRDSGRNVTTADRRQFVLVVTFWIAVFSARDPMRVGIRTGFLGLPSAVKLYSTPGVLTHRPVTSGRNDFQYLRYYSPTCSESSGTFPLNCIDDTPSRSSSLIFSPPIDPIISSSFRMSSFSNPRACFKLVCLLSFSFTR